MMCSDAKFIFSVPITLPTSKPLSTFIKTYTACLLSEVFTEDPSKFALPSLDKLLFSSFKLCKIKYNRITKHHLTFALFVQTASII